MSGIELSRRFYASAVAPLLGDVRHAAALLGDGSEVLGYDDDVSPDHDFGPRVQVFLAPDADQGAVRAALAGMSARFEDDPVDAQVELAVPAAYFGRTVGADPAEGMGLADWLLTPTQRFLALTAGAVFHDPDGWLTRRRTALAWYPDDVWRYVLAASWLRVSQEEAFVGRTGATGDELGSRVLAARLVRDLARLAFLVHRRWAPYGKWFGRAFADLPIAPDLGVHLGAALAATEWREREASVGRAASLLATATNELGLAEPVDPAVRQFYTRDIHVLGADRLVIGLTAAITDPQLCALLDRLGRNPRSGVGVLPGAIDQAVDSVEVLTRPDRCRAMAPVLGLRTV
jgi:hypothetical protein